MGQQECCEIQQGEMPSPAPRKNETLAGKALWERPVSTGKQRAEQEKLRALAATQARSSWAVWTRDQPGDPRKGFSPLLSPQKTPPRYLVSGEKMGVN